MATATATAPTGVGGAQERIRVTVESGPLARSKEWIIKNLIAVRETGKRFWNWLTDISVRWARGFARGARRAWGWTVRNTKTGAILAKDYAVAGGKWVWNAGVWVWYTTPVAVKRALGYVGLAGSWVVKAVTNTVFSVSYFGWLIFGYVIAMMAWSTDQYDEKVHQRVRHFAEPGTTVLTDQGVTNEEVVHQTTPRSRSAFEFPKAWVDNPTLITNALLSEQFEDQQTTRDFYKALVAKFKEMEDKEWNSYYLGRVAVLDDFVGFSEPMAWEPSHVIRHYERMFADDKRVDQARLGQGMHDELHRLYDLKLITQAVRDSVRIDLKQSPTAPPGAAKPRKRGTTQSKK